MPIARMDEIGYWDTILGLPTKEYMMLISLSKMAANPTIQAVATASFKRS